MDLQWIDWCVLIGSLILITTAVRYTNRYSKSVADFLAANRSAGRYLVAVGEGMAHTGAIGFILTFEVFYKAGFCFIWWDMVRLLFVPTILSITGFVIYRFRQTRALTLGQFFEMRYSRNFRIFGSLISWFSGIVNFGIFPAVGARFRGYALYFQR